VADTYRSTQAALARRDEQVRDALFDALLEGRAGDPATRAQAATALGLPETDRLLVVAIEVTADALAPDDPRILMGKVGFPSAWRHRPGRCIGVVQVGDRDEASAVAALQPVLRSRAGVSPVFEQLDDAARALHLAEVALETMPVEGVGATALDERLSAALLVSTPALADRLLRRTLGPLLAVEPEERATLLATLRAWIDSDGSAERAAAALFCHRNTVLNRMRRISAITGRSMTSTVDLVDVTLAMEALRLHREAAPMR
jgi:hypothetical protein